MNKKVFVTGATGMVGSHLIDFLLDNTDWEIIGLIRWRSPLDNLESALNHFESDRLKFKYADIRDSLALSKVVESIEPDYCFHLAAQSFPKTSFDSPNETLCTNIEGTVNLLESLKRYSPKCVIHVCSSSEIFGRVPQEKLPIVEECNFHPASPYAISKAGTDLLGRFYAEAYNMNVQITRMFTHTGPRRGDVFAESSFAKQIAINEYTNSSNSIEVGNLDSLRTIADVRDAVRAYYMLLTINPIPGSYYNIGGNKVMTVKEILEFLMANSTIKNLNYKVDSERLRPLDADLQIPSTSKFKKHTGWEPQIDHEKTLLDLLNYWRIQIRKGKVVINR